MKPIRIISFAEVEPIDLTKLKGRHVTGTHRRLIDVEDTEEGIIVGLGELDQGDLVDWHAHPEGEEAAIFVIEGKALVEWKINDETRVAEAEPGTAVYTPAGLLNRVRNPYRRRLRYVYFTKVAARPA